MDAPPIHDPVAQVVSWHNRNPLARRIAPQHVQGLGVVSLPFVTAADPQPAAWWRRVKLALQALVNPGKKLRAFAGPALQLAFGERFIDSVSLERLATFALRHGSPQSTDSALPHREMPALADIPSESILRLYLSTAAVEVGTRQVRVLIGSGKVPDILGNRLWDPLRLAAAAALLVVLVGLPIGLWLGLSPAAPGAASDAATAAPATPVNATASGSVMRSAGLPEPPAVATAALPASEPASSAPAPAPGPEAPTSAAASAPQVQAAASAVAKEAPLERLKPALPTLSPEARAQALSEGRLLRAKIQNIPATELTGNADAAPRKAKASKVMADEPPAAPSASAPAPGKVYALVGSLTGTRAASERRLHLMGLGFAGKKMAGSLRSEIMKVDKGWRATLWPFASRSEAEAARDQLAEEGVYTEVVGF